MRPSNHVGGIVLACLAAAAPAAAGPCAAPEKMTAAQQRECVKQATIALPQPTLTAEQVTNGPDFSTDPAKRFLYFTGTDQPICFFKPHYAFSKVPGVSLKFRCWQQNASRAFLDGKGAPVEVSKVAVVLEPNDQGEKRGRLMAVAADGTQTRIRADELKVKYLDPAWPNHNTRYNEVFTEIAATRIMWILGFIADHAYPAAQVECVGCQPMPFNGQKDNKAQPRDAGVVFKLPLVEREHAFDPLEVNGVEYWAWPVANEFYRSGWTRQQKVEFDAYRLALRLINYFNTPEQQNRVACAKWQNDDNDSGTCEQPMILVQDLGSTFGKPKSWFLGTNKRGDFRGYSEQPVFSNKSQCRLLHALDGDAQVIEDGRKMLVERLARLDRPTVEAIFKVARFDQMDKKQLDGLRSSGVSDVGPAAIKQWTDTFMSRIEEVKTATGCRP